MRENRGLSEKHQSVYVPNFIKNESNISEYARSCVREYLDELRACRKLHEDEMFVTTINMTEKFNSELREMQQKIPHCSLSEFIRCAIIRHEIRENNQRIANEYKREFDANPNIVKIENKTYKVVRRLE